MNKSLLLFLAFAFSVAKTNAQCEPQLLHCNLPVQACDLSPNASELWNEIYWWDNVIQSHDLAETPIDLNLIVRDTCPGDSLSVRCLLFLDLDNDGVQETVVDSDNPPGPGMVNYNNAGNPNYSGGTPRVFDSRPVPINQKWRFNLKTSVSGDTSTFNLLWNNEFAPSLFTLPELALGNHKVRWIVTNKAGISNICEKSFLAKDCKAPTVVCLNGLSVNIMPTQMIQLWVSDFIQYAEDNVTPTGQLRYGVRKLGTGAGFPVDANGNPVTSVLFNCAELGTQSVEVWAMDLAGNSDYCETYVIVLDNNGNCNNTPGPIKACAILECGNAISEETTFSFSGTVPFQPPFSYFEIGACASINQVLPANTDVTITPSLDDNPLNGVTTYDLVLLANFINGITPFSSPYQWVAADANKDNQVDTFDILECKKLILGIYTQLPNNTSWRFVDKNYVFPSPNPLSVPFPESITVNTSNLPAVDPEFVGIKICDLNCAGLVDFYELTPESEHLIGIPAPNPTQEGAMLPIQLISAETVVLEVMDFSGRLLFQRVTHLPEGPALLEIPASALPAAGVYVWRVRAGELVKAGKLVRN
jgi:hypothetical protein